MRAAVIGGSGQIGGWLLRRLAGRGHHAVGTFATTPLPGLDPLDAADRPAAARWVGAQRPDVVFYPAGFTWVDACERDPVRARDFNRDQPLDVARAAARLGARFVYFSTDYIFDGRDGPYAEDAEPAPLNEYGRAKLDAERALTELLGDSLLIVRTCWAFGPERQGKNFAYQLLRTLSQGKTLSCPSDQVSSPSYAPDVARAVVDLAEAGASGIVHVAGPETIDRVTFARALAEGFGYDPALIVPVPTAELGQGAPRPLKSGLKIERLQRSRPCLMRPLAAAVRDFRARLAAREGWADPLAPA